MPPPPAPRGLWFEAFLLTLFCFGVLSRAVLIDHSWVIAVVGAIGVAGNAYNAVVRFVAAREHAASTEAKS